MKPLDETEDSTALASSGVEGRGLLESTTPASSGVEGRGLLETETPRLDP